MVLNVVPWGPIDCKIGPVTAPESVIYTVRLNVAEQLGMRGLIAMPLGWTASSSMMETEPVEGRKR